MIQSHNQRNMRLWSMLRWPSKGITIGNTFAKKRGELDLCALLTEEAAPFTLDWTHWTDSMSQRLSLWSQVTLTPIEFSTGAAVAMPGFQWSADSWSLWICITLSLCHFGPACTHIHSNILASQCIHVYTVYIRIPCTPSKLSRLNTYHPDAGKVPVGFQNQAQGLHRPDLRCAEITASQHRINKRKLSTQRSDAKLGHVELQWSKEKLITNK